MEAKKVGAAIKILRSRAGYTQQELASRLGVTDKAISKWERGLGVPDISIITKLSVLLDIDVDNLLEGNIAYLDDNWRGILILDGDGEIYSATECFGKPIVYFPISYFLLVGIKDIMVVCGNNDRTFLEKRLASGADIGIFMHFCGNIGELRVSNYENIMVVRGYHFIYGPNLTKYFQRAMGNKKGITTMVIPRRNGMSCEKVGFDNRKRIVTEKDMNYYRLPISFYPSWLNSQITGENCHNEYAEPMGNGMFDHPLNNYRDIHMVSQYINIVEESSGKKIYLLPEVAFMRGLIDEMKLKEISEYHYEREYLKKLCG